MRIVEYSIAEQHDKYGFFGEIRQEVHPLKIHGLIDLELPSVHSSWENCIRFGANYFLEHAPEIKGLQLKVLQLRTMDVDSSYILVAYITIKALEKEYGKEGATNVFFNAEQKTFTFVK